ncbi:MAG: SAV_2336 N-terminal domain-related protein [Planctomycetota bacterium]
MPFTLSRCLRDLKLQGVDLAPEEFCDALWLAAHGFMPGETHIIPAATPPMPSNPSPSPSPPPTNTGQTKTPDGSEQQNPSQPVHALSDSDDRKMRGQLLSVPAPPAIARGFEFDRALRPLRQHRQIARSQEVDEEATVAAIAESGVWQIVMRPARSRWLEIVLVVERSPTMRIWQETALEFRKLLWRACAPYSLRTFYLDWSPQKLTMHSSGGSPVSCDSPCHGNNNRLVLVLSDAMSVGWLTADIPELLSRWAGRQTTTLVQMLPESMWPRSALRHVTLAAADQPRSATATRVTDDTWPRVTVIPLEPDHLRRYARMLNGTGAEGVGAYRGSRPQFGVVDRHTAERRPPFNPQALSTEEVEKIFQRFQQFASLEARNLAKHLASAPLILPVMRLVQRVLVPDAAPAQLAEIFLSGILYRRQSATLSDAPPNQIEYEFLPGVRDRLLDLGGLDRSFETIELLSRYFEERFGKGGAFTALLANPSAVAKEFNVATADSQSQPFVRIAGMLLERMGFGHVSGGQTASDGNDEQFPSQPSTSTGPNIDRVPSSNSPERIGSKCPTIFLSGVSHEFSSFRDVVENEIKTKGWFTENQLGFPPDTRTVEEMLRRKLKDSDAVIHIVGFRFGAEPKQRPTGAPRRSYTQLEFDIARELKKPVYVFLSHDATVSDKPALGEQPEAAEIAALQLKHREVVRKSNHLLYYFNDKADLCKLVAKIPEVDAPDFRADISRIIKYAPTELIGRETETTLLNDAWFKVGRDESPRPHILTFVALGGEGKTSLVAKWVTELAHRNWPGCDAAFAWSFYSQGTREQAAVSSDLFLAEALAFFGDAAMAGSAMGAWDKGTRLAQLVGERRTLLILDGLEPLQYAPTSAMPGLKDPALIALLKGLAANNAGLCVITTRYAIPDLRAFLGKTVREEQLARLSNEAGVALLRSLGVRGTTKEFAQLVEDMKGHALTLNLLGSYLRDAHGGDIHKRDSVSLEMADAEEQGGHAFRVMDAYVKSLEDGDVMAPRDVRGRCALALLHLLGLFDGPATADRLNALWNGEVIAGLTEPLVGISDADRNSTLARLEEAKLLTVNRAIGSGVLVSIDTHPLLREYFAQHLRKMQPDAWRAAHRRLDEYGITTGVARPVLLILNDDLELAKELEHLARESGWDVIVTRSIENAQEMCSRSQRHFNAALIDLMIPKDGHDLRLLDEHLAVRDKHIHASADQENKGDRVIGEQQRLIAELRKIDQAISKLIQIDGGIQFLRSQEAQAKIVLPGTNVAIFSARDPNVVADSDAGISLRDAVAKVIGRENVKWFHLPVPPEEIESWLRSASGKARSGESLHGTDVETVL